MMDKTKEERKLLLSKIEDACKICQKRGSVCQSNFTDPASAIFIKRNLKLPYGVKVDFFGGYEDAERVMFFAYPDWMDEHETEIDKILISQKGKFGANLSHRDYLGAILGMGITRDVIGDILIKDGQALVFCKNDISDYIIYNLSSVGRNSVDCKHFEGNAEDFTEKKVLKESVNVASVRLDGIISAIYRLSRGSSVELIESGCVKVNYEECLKTDVKLNSDDIISVRGYGKVKFLDVSGTSKKGRLFIDIEKYV